MTVPYATSLSKHNSLSIKPHALTTFILPVLSRIFGLPMSTKSDPSARCVEKLLRNEGGWVKVN